jgi:AcrR family transcriptional regulator
VSELPTIQPQGLELPVVGEPSERADAARNRDRILCAAAQLFEESADPNAVTMDAVAAAAGVGKGTVFRRFGDRAGLMRALLDEHETAFQENAIRGEPPLGPGAPAVERLREFGRRYIELADAHVDLLAAAQAAAVALSGPFDFYRTHVAILLAEAAPGIDVEYATEALLSGLRAPLHLHLRRDRGWPLERIQAGWDANVTGWVAQSGA